MVSGRRGVAGVRNAVQKLPGRRLRRAIYLVLLAVLIGLTIAYWSWVDAQARAVVVISSVLDAPVLSPAVRVVSGEPRLSDVRVAGHRSLVARPAGEGPWPTIFVVNGTVPEGRRLHEIRRLAEGLARAGYLVVVPDLPGLMEDRITPETVDETVKVARKVSEQTRRRGRTGGPRRGLDRRPLAVLAAGDSEPRNESLASRRRRALLGHKDRPERRNDWPLPPVGR